MFSYGQTISAKYYRSNILPIYSDTIEDRTLFHNKKKNSGVPAHRDIRNVRFMGSKVTTSWGRWVWSGRSPDLNPFDNLGSILKDSMYETPRPTTKDALIKRFQKVWKSIPVDTLENLAESFKKRVEELIKVGGGHTTY